MNKVLSKTWFALSVRAILGMIFIAASIEKAASPEAFSHSILDYRILSPSLALLVATVMPWVELLAGIGLLCGIWIRGSSLLVCTMLVAFTIALMSALWRGLDISCGCFTQDPSAARIGWQKILENTAMLLGGISLLLSKNIHYSLDERLRSPSPDSRL